jgi:hypothetical protein
MLLLVGTVWQWTYPTRDICEDMHVMHRDRTDFSLINPKLKSPQAQVNYIIVF